VPGGQRGRGQQLQRRDGVQCFGRVGGRVFLQPQRFLPGGEFVVAAGLLFTGGVQQRPAEFIHTRVILLPRIVLIGGGFHIRGGIFFCRCIVVVRGGLQQQRSPRAILKRGRVLLLVTGRMCHRV